MKFRAIIKDDHVIQEFINILISLAKMDKNVCLNMKENKMVLFVCCDNLDISPIFWCDIDSNSYFTSYIMSGQSAEHNEIYIVLPSQNLLQTLPGIQKATEYLKIKLAKNPFQVLTIETELKGTNENHKRLLELPIMVLPLSDWYSYQLPVNQAYDISITATHLKHIRGVIDSLKNLGPEINICITKDGVLAFIVEQDEYTTTSQFSELSVTVTGKDDLGNDISEASCLINSRRLAAVMANHTFQHVYTTFSIQQDFVFKIEFEIKKDVILTCILPAINREN